MTATKSRKKHQQKVISKALQNDKLNKKIARENFNFSDISFLHFASYEPLLHQTKEEPEESNLDLDEIFKNKNIVYILFDLTFLL